MGIHLTKKQIFEGEIPECFRTASSDMTYEQYKKAPDWHEKLENLALIDIHGQRILLNLPHLKGFISDLLDAYAEENNQFYYKRGFLDAEEVWREKLAKVAKTIVYKSKSMIEKGNPIGWNRGYNKGLSDAAKMVRDAMSKKDL